MKQEKTLRERVERRFINQTEIPLIIFVFLIIAIYGATLLDSYNEDLSLNLVSELIGATFILLVVNLLLVRSKHKRWKLVNEKVNYLIARSVFRLRDGISSRGFSFHEQLIENNENFTPQDLHNQREDYIEDILQNSENQLTSIFNDSFFNEENLNYFYQKSQDFWELMNMKYAEFLEPELVELLMDVHAELIDLNSAIRTNLKINHLQIKQSTQTNCVRHLHNLLVLTNELKELGYSQYSKSNYLVVE